jgi:hypothetical protein
MTLDPCWVLLGCLTFDIVRLAPPPIARGVAQFHRPRSPERSKQARAIPMNSLAGILVQRNTEYCIAQTKIVN